MTAQSNFPINDLVLRLAGGERDGELIPVKTPKCFLGMEQNSHEGAAEQPHCAIFRGPNGAAVRSYGDQVSVNGVAATVHWLKQGDRIEFPNSMTVEVAQLGWVKAACKELEDVQQASANCQPENPPPAGEETCQPLFTDQIGCLDNVEQPGSDNKQPSESDMPAQECQASLMTQPSDQEDARVDLIESKIQDIQSQSQQTLQRFDELETQITTLSQQISQLISHSHEPTNHAEDNEESFMTFGNRNESVQSQSSETLQDEEVSIHEESSNSIEHETNAEDNDYQSTGDYYSHLDDDDEKIMSFDPESEVADEVEPSTSNVEIIDAPTELSSQVQTEIDSRLSEMERVFGSNLAEADPEVIEPSSDQPANELTVDSFETPTHGLNEGSDSFADSTLSENSESVEPDSHANQPEGEAMSEESQTETLIENPPAVDEPDEASPPSNSSSSVAELLARMQAEGQWDGIPDGDEPVESVEPVVEPMAAVPVDSNVAEDSEDDVQDYMSQLLNRMRHGEPAAKPKPVEKKAPNKPEAEVAEVAEPVFQPPTNPLKPGEFKPSQQAQRIELSAMRELANSTSRHAVKASEKTRLKELGYVQIGIAVCSFFMSIYYFLWNSQSFLDTGFIVGLVCVVIAGFLGYRFYSTMKDNELSESATKPSAAGDSEEDKSPEQPVVT